MGSKGNKTHHVAFLSRRPLFSRVTLWIIKSNIMAFHLRIITTINTTRPLKQRNEVIKIVGGTYQSGKLQKNRAIAV